MPANVQIPLDQSGVRACLSWVEGNLADQVTWVNSYVSADKRKTFCIYDAASPEALHRATARNRLLLERITEVRSSARAPQHAYAGWAPDKLLKQRGVADAGLIGSERGATTVLQGARKPPGKVGETLFALEECHGIRNLFGSALASLYSQAAKIPLPIQEGK